jgi:hypothetical protein
MMRKFDKQSLFSWSPAALLKLAASSGAFLGGAIDDARQRHTKEELEGRSREYGCGEKVEGTRPTP